MLDYYCILNMLSSENKDIIIVIIIINKFPQFNIPDISMVIFSNVFHLVKSCSIINN